VIHCEISTCSSVVVPNSCAFNSALAAFEARYCATVPVPERDPSGAVRVGTSLADEENVTATSQKPATSFKEFDAGCLESTSIERPIFVELSDALLLTRVARGFRRSENVSEERWYRYTSDGTGTGYKGKNPSAYFSFVLDKEKTDTVLSLIGQKPPVQ
jgi:hypothetical protein